MNLLCLSKAPLILERSRKHDFVTINLQLLQFLRDLQFFNENFYSSFFNYFHDASLDRLKNIHQRKQDL